MIFRRFQQIAMSSCNIFNFIFNLYLIYIYIHLVLTMLIGLPGNPMPFL
jgi:hypothetical protein